MSGNPDLVLVVSDMFVPSRSPDIPEQFKAILTPNRMQHVLSLGNIGSVESYDWLKSLSNDFHCVKGDYDEGDLPEKKVVQIGEFKIGMIHGHQVLPWGSIDALSSIQRELGCDILLSGHTHMFDLKNKDGKFFLNPGSISGSFSSVCPSPSPSFILMVLTGEEATIYVYALNEGKKGKFEVSKIEFNKGANEFKKIEDEEEAQGGNEGEGESAQQEGGETLQE